MKVLVYGNTIPHTVDCSIAFHGFEELEADITISQILPLKKEELENFDVCVAGVDLCHWVLFKLGIKNFEIECYPNELMRFCERHIETVKLKDLLNGCAKNKFVKPVKPKSFLSFICSDVLPEILMGQDENSLVYVSDPVEFVSEWRVYVNKGNVENICFYKGNPLVFPKIMPIRAMIESWTNSPCCYALDVGVMLKDYTVLVEVNDFYAIGNYGLESKTYAEMLLYRWTELTHSRRS